MILVSGGCVWGPVSNGGGGVWRALPARRGMPGPCVVVHATAKLEADDSTPMMCCCQLTRQHGSYNPAILCFYIVVVFVRNMCASGEGRLGRAQGGGGRGALQLGLISSSWLVTGQGVCTDSHGGVVTCMRAQLLSLRGVLHASFHRSGRTAVMHCGAV